MLNKLSASNMIQFIFFLRFMYLFKRERVVGRGRGTECPSRLLLSRESNMGLNLTSHEIRT